MVNYAALYEENINFETAIKIAKGTIIILLAVAIYFVFCKVFEKIFPKYGGNKLLSSIICGGFFIIALLNLSARSNWDTKRYSDYGIENRKNFIENYNKIQSKINYRMDIKNKNEYINKILNRFYGNVDVSVPNEEILKKLKR